MYITEYERQKRDQATLFLFVLNHWKHLTLLFGFTLSKKYLKLLFYNPRRIFSNSLILWAQDDNTTCLLTSTEVPAENKDY